MIHVLNWSVDKVDEEMKKELSKNEDTVVIAATEAEQLWDRVDDVVRGEVEDPVAGARGSPEWRQWLHKKTKSKTRERSGSWRQGATPVSGRLRAG